MLKSGGSIQVSVTLEVVATVEIIFGAGATYITKIMKIVLQYISLF